MKLVKVNFCRDGGRGSPHNTKNKNQEEKKMSFEVIESVFTIKADAIMTTALAAVMLLMGAL